MNATVYYKPFAVSSPNAREKRGLLCCVRKMPLFVPPGGTFAGQNAALRRKLPLFVPLSGNFSGIFTCSISNEQQMHCSACTFACTNRRFQAK
ncbi:MAG: hypothetical protein IKH82_04060 [Clostridiales bacterium]|nr:hypothetical protein [Clostridiales bacterium]